MSRGDNNAKAYGKRAILRQAVSLLHSPFCSHTSIYTTHKGLQEDNRYLCRNRHTGRLDSKQKYKLPASQYLSATNKHSPDILTTDKAIRQKFRKFPDSPLNQQ